MGAEFPPLSIDDRAGLIIRVDGCVYPHRAPLRRQMVSIPFRAVGRILTVKLAALVSRVGWDFSFRRRTFFGDTIKFPFPACWDLLVYRSYIDEAELRLLKFLIKYLPVGSTVIDVGANIGFFSLLTSKIAGAKGRILAFEPGQQALDYLRENLEGCANTEIVEMAASDRRGDITFFEGRGSSVVSSSTVEKHMHSRDHFGFSTITVPAIPLDEYCAENQLAPTLIKIDVEGAEIEVLRGSLGVLKRHRPWVVLEISFTGEEYAELYAPCVELLGEIGYMPHVVDAGGTPRPIGLREVAEHGENCARDLGYLHGLDNLLFIHPDRGLTQN